MFVTPSKHTGKNLFKIVLGNFDNCHVYYN